MELWGEYTDSLGGVNSQMRTRVHYVINFHSNGPKHGPQPHTHHQTHRRTFARPHTSRWEKTRACTKERGSHSEGTDDLKDTRTHLTAPRRTTNAALGERAACVRRCVSADEMFVHKSMTLAACTYERACPYRIYIEKVLQIGYFDAHGWWSAHIVDAQYSNHVKPSPTDINYSKCITLNC